LKNENLICTNFFPMNCNFNFLLKKKPTNTNWSGSAWWCVVVRGGAWWCVVVRGVWCVVRGAYCVAHLEVKKRKRLAAKRYANHLND
jgi:hypothetical protein